MDTGALFAHFGGTYFRHPIDLPSGGPTGLPFYQNKGLLGPFKAIYFLSSLLSSLVVWSLINNVCSSRYMCLKVQEIQSVQLFLPALTARFTGEGGARENF